jgi:hypothetical protein
MGVSASFAAVNPFMDVPLNHWAYDAIGQLAARGVLSGYPDGAYNGKQPTSRYEMASAVARALALTDLSKAAKQDAAMLQKLVAEFRNELDALGVKVDEMDVRVGAMEDRLGGWKIGGELRMDLAVETWKILEQALGQSANLTRGEVSRARLELHRWFGADEGIYFYARLEENDGNVIFDKFYADVPFVWNSTLTAGRFDRDFESDYRFSIGGATDISNEAWMSDRTVDGLGLSKSVGAGSVNFYMARPALQGYLQDDATFDIWEFHLFTRVQFSERFGFDIGAQYLLGDDASVFTLDPTRTPNPFIPNPNIDITVSDILTLYGGLRFNFTPSAAIKAFYAYQDASAERSVGANVWRSIDSGSVNAWKLIFDANLLEASKFWLELGHLDQGFYLPYDNTALTLGDDAGWNSRDGGAGVIAYDTHIWRVGGLHQWNEKWSTWLYAAGHWLSPDNLPESQYNGFQLGVGAEYRYNEYVAFALNFVHVDWDNYATRDLFLFDAHRLQFRTRVTF